MTECAVFGIIAARSAIAQLSGSVKLPAAPAQAVEEPASQPAATSSEITLDQLKHNNGENGAPLWAAIHGQVYLPAPSSLAVPSSLADAVPSSLADAVCPGIRSD